MDPKPVLAIIITILVLVVGIYSFSDKSNIKLFGDRSFGDQVSEARRNIPVEASLSSLKSFSFNFDTTGKSQDVTFVFVADNTIKINGQSIKSKADDTSLNIADFSGSITISNGSASVNGKGMNVELGDLEFDGESTVEASGRIIRISLAQVQGDFKFLKVSGSFNVITNQTKQTFTVRDQDTEFKNFLGSIELVKGNDETVNIEGATSKVVTNEFTISKDY